ncbi:MAG: hypothetical protein NVS9B8_00020 [Candidatus Limnocylindrales bacterium]
MNAHIRLAGPDDAGALARLRWNMRAAPPMYASNVYVEAIHRNEGLGSRMLREVTTWCQTDPRSVAVGWSSDDAVADCRRAGFEASDAVQFAFDVDQSLTLRNESVRGETS